MNFVSNDLWYISDKNGSEFYNMFTSKAEAEEECRRRGGGYVGQLYKVNFGIEDTLGFADKIIGGLYEILYDCVGVQAGRWNREMEEEKEELDLKLGKVIIDFINEKQLQPNNYCYAIFDMEKVE